MEKKTFIVGGNYRGGTTATTTLLEGAGINMGEYGDAGNHEDKAFQKIIHFEYGRQKYTDEEYRAAIQAEAEKRNRQNDVWGFKYPGVFKSLPKIIDLFRNPHVIYILRDPVSVALSEADRSGQGDFLAIAERTIMFNEAMVDQAAMLPKIADCSVLLLSYERMLTEPKQLIYSLQTFTGERFDPETILPLIKKQKKHNGEAYIFPAFGRSSET